MNDFAALVILTMRRGLNPLPGSAMTDILILLVAGAACYLLDQLIDDRGILDPDFPGDVPEDLQLPDSASATDGRVISHWDEEAGGFVWMSVPELVDSTPVVEESLPLPFVHYPWRYRGVYLGFSEAPNDTPILCACVQSTVEHYLRSAARLRWGDVGARLTWGPTDEEAPEDSRAAKVASLRGILPGRLAVAIVDSLQAGEDPAEPLTFRPELCHKCRQAVPAGEAPSTQGTRFRTHFYWYVNQRRHEFGLEASGRVLFGVDKGIADADRLPDELRSLAEEMPRVGTGLSSEAYDRAEEISRRASTWIENEVRNDFGVRGVGESWLSETILHRIVDQLFRDLRVLHRARPDWLDGQELDVYVPDLDLALEYQGEQHYEPVEHFGGEEAFEETQRRDRRKEKRCDAAGVTLVEVPYTAELTPPTVAKLLLDQQPEAATAMRSAKEVAASEAFQKRIEGLRERSDPRHLSW